MCVHVCVGEYVMCMRVCECKLVCIALCKYPWKQGKVNGQKSYLPEIFVSEIVLLVHFNYRGEVKVVD